MGSEGSDQGVTCRRLHNRLEEQSLDLWGSAEPPPHGQGRLAGCPRLLTLAISTHTPRLGLPSPFSPPASPLTLSQLGG